MAKYPIGIQTFEHIMREKWVYVDKTALVYKLVTEGKFYFLSRPRRFGKSLLLSTLEAYFLAKKHLFEGLEISHLEKEWIEYPVLHFDFSGAEAKSTEKLEIFLRNRLIDFEEQFGIERLDRAGSVGERFGMLLSRICAKIGRRVVVLVDEYDKGIIDVMQHECNFESNQELLRNFFMQLKVHDNHIRFCMLTGVARFRHLTIFSGLNNINDISLDTDYAAICGITESELFQNFGSGIKTLSDSLHKSEDETIEMLRLKYEGYRFSGSEIKVYNPFSLLSCFGKKSMANHWLMSGTSHVFLSYLSRSQFDLMRLQDCWATGEALGGMYTSDNPLPMLYQTGYLTITGYEDGVYRLGIPNGEVRYALVSELMPQYMGVSKDDVNTRLLILRRKVMNRDIDGFMTELKAMIANVPYQEMQWDNLEKSYHLILYFIFLMLGVNTRSEIATSGGRVDMIAETDNFVYLFEFKLGGTPEIAMQQIEDRGYALAWSDCGRPVYKIGVVFSPKTRTIDKWKYVVNQA